MSTDAWMDRLKSPPGVVDLGQMMREQHDIQLLIGGSDPRERTDEEKMAYVREMALAVNAEMIEALGETGWKTWASSNHIDSPKFGAELVDALQFLMNLFTLAGWSAADIETQLRKKHQINRDRVSRGYTGLDKCECGRAFDDPTVDCSPERCASQETDLV